MKGKMVKQNKKNIEEDEKATQRANAAKSDFSI